ncbi:Oidioi.mRNA.OKI2018_I69.chr2.g7970.t1.cds [Oikopleura dioica]|uniref:Oidioi.mRNA.OKI2018_I69.chr2.g7970.t1.cds n=1 Tax=Oikopleura dioica TaxID=34765 RepID=A0ABN7TA51_OIKDI|nr:Oidioi.mRNA.OKI2018_I69.chr2.g7970.t1.cds [Oikopleura dioica]
MYLYDGYPVPQPQHQSTPSQRPGSPSRSSAPPRSRRESPTSSIRSLASAVESHPLETTFLRPATPASRRNMPFHPSFVGQAPPPPPPQTTAATDREINDPEASGLGPIGSGLPDAPGLNQIPMTQEAAMPTAMPIVDSSAAFRNDGRNQGPAIMSPFGQRLRFDCTFLMLACLASACIAVFIYVCIALQSKCLPTHLDGGSENSSNVPALSRRPSLENDEGNSLVGGSGRRRRRSLNDSRRGLYPACECHCQCIGVTRQCPSEDDKDADAAPNSIPTAPSPFPTALPTATRASADATDAVASDEDDDARSISTKWASDLEFDSISMNPGFAEWMERQNARLLEEERAERRRLAAFTSSSGEEDEDGSTDEAMAHLDAVFEEEVGSGATMDEVPELENDEETASPRQALTTTADPLAESFNEANSASDAIDVANSSSADVTAHYDADLDTVVVKLN